MPATDDAVPTARRVCLVCRQEYGTDEKRCPKDGTVLVALAADPYTGRTLADRYAIKSLIGSGGTSVVYKAHHLQLNRPVAIKMLKAHLVTDEDSKRRFEQEARAVSCLTHPHVVTVYDVGVTKYGEPYIVMEYLEGTSLSDIIASEGRLDIARGMPIFQQACAALAHAHKKEVVHRDVKPSNIMLVRTDDNPEFVKIVDFGLAKLRSLTGEFQRLTKTGEVFGSPVYMSPEQCTGKKLDERTDIYSMGVVMFETLTGRPPFKERTSIETIRRQIKEAAPRPNDVCPEANLPKALEDVILKALSKNPEDRFKSMDELRAVLDAFSGRSTTSVSNELPTISRPPELRTSSNPLPAVAGQPANNTKLIIGIVAVVAIAAIALLALLRH
jgi:serine/threonine-protein kinase